MCFYIVIGVWSGGKRGGGRIFFFFFVFGCFVSCWLLLSFPLRLPFLCFKVLAYFSPNYPVMILFITPVANTSDFLVYLILWVYWQVWMKLRKNGEVPLIWCPVRQCSSHEVGLYVRPSGHKCNWFPSLYQKPASTTGGSCCLSGPWLFNPLLASS